MFRLCSKFCSNSVDIDLTIIMFPVEIWEKILKNIDAVDLFRLRIVNNLWNDIIVKHLRESDAWFRQCSKDIPEEYWPLLLENSLHLTTLLQLKNKEAANNEYFNHHDFDHKLWMTVYRAWKKWTNIECSSTHIVNKFHPMPSHRPTEHVTCSATLGELVAIGTTEGYIRIFNLRSNKLVFRVDQYVHVLDVKLLANSDKIILIATLVNSKSRVWDITRQKSLMAMTGNVICAGYGYYCTTSCHDKILLYDETNKNHSAVRLFIKDYNMKPNARHYSDTKAMMKYVDMIINEQQLCFFSDTGLYCELSLQEINNSQKTLYTPEVTYIGVPKNHKVYRYYLFNPHILFCITEKGHLGISVNKSKWQVYNVYPFLEGQITAVAFHVRVLVLGLDSGVVCIYFIECNSTLQAMNFKSRKCKRINVASQPIICANIMEIDGDQRLLAATKNTVYHIKLDSKSSSQ